MANEVTADKDYKYDPDHKNKPMGGNWEKTESGWTTKKHEKSQGKLPFQNLVNKLVGLNNYIKQNPVGKFKAEPKDTERINSIIQRANGDSNKIYQYSNNMANAINDPDKAIRRGVAAYRELKVSIIHFDPKFISRVANLFFRKADALVKNNQPNAVENNQPKPIERKRYTTPLQGMMNTLDVLGKHVKQDHNGKFIVENKDWERISSILKKSNGDSKKAYHYSMNMAQAITDPAKAVRRGIATYDSLKGSFGSAVAIETANVFLKRAIELQSKAEQPVAPVKQTPESPKSPSFLRSFIIKSKKISDSGLIKFYPHDEKKVVLEPIDKERIRTIISKSGGDNAKMEMFVKNMANAITDPAKAARRGVAILQGLRDIGKNVASRRMADIFFTKALYLIGDVGEKEVDPKPISDSNPPKNISAPAAPVKEIPVEEPIKESPAKPVSKQPKFRKMKPKLQASMHYLIKDNKLNKDEVEELAGFKNSIMDHPMMSDKEFKRRVENGLRLPRNQQQLKNAFVQHMDARNYGSPEAFAKAKERIQKMPVGDFGKLLGAIMGEEEA